MTEIQTPVVRRSPVTEFASHLITMPRWHKGTLMMAVLLSLLGLVAKGYELMNRPAAPVTNAPPAVSSNTPNSTAAPATPPGAFHAVGNNFANSSAGNAANPVNSQPEATAAQDQSQTTQTWTPWATRIGVSYIVGFVVGWIFRAFLKMAAIVAVLAGAMMSGLSYFNVMNVDMTAARQHYTDAQTWAGDQATKLKDLVFSHLPSGGTAAVALFMGFRRR